MKKPNILITNDDGVNASGIKYLCKALEDIATVTVVAPITERSASGMGLTVRHPLHLQEHHWSEKARIYSVTGTPADCIKMALSVVLDSTPDLVVSGINRGSNAGRNAIYSGTVAGTIEGALRGIPGIAFSCVSSSKPYYDTASRFVPRIVEHVLSTPLNPGTVLNVNVPSRKYEDIVGMRVTRQGLGYWIEDPEKRVHPAGEPYYWLGGKLIDHHEDEGRDTDLLEQGYLTATPLHVSELTDYLEVEKRQKSFSKLMT